MIFPDGYRAKCQHGRIYRFNAQGNEWEAENPEPDTGEIGCSRCLFIMLSEFRQPKLLEMEGLVL